LEWDEAFVGVSERRDERSYARMENDKEAERVRRVERRTSQVYCCVALPSFPTMTKLYRESR
jgi:hypothetical protein